VLSRARTPPFAGGDRYVAEVDDGRMRQPQRRTNFTTGDTSPTVEETAVADSGPDSASVAAGSPAGSAAQLAEYNYEHFRAKHLLADVWRSVKGEGVKPGSEAPDFELRSTEPRSTVE
jgi:hypothetical protein